MLIGLSNLSLMQRRSGGAVFSPLDLSPSLWMSAGGGLYTGGARQFTAANGELFTIADNAALSVADVDFTIAGWIKLSSIDAGSSRIIVAKGNLNSVAACEYALYLNDTQARFSISNGTTLSTAASAAVLAVGTWYFIVGWHDSVANTVNISVNEEATVSTAHSVGCVDGSGAFSVGDDLAGRFFDGLISKLLFSKRKFSASEITWLRNSGNGRVLGQLGVASTDGSALLTSLFGYWNMNEASGNAIDAHGTNDLTDTNTVTSADGPGEEIAADSVGSAHGTLANFADPDTAWSSDRPTPIAALVDGSLAFDGVNDYLNIGNPSAVQLTTAVSVSLWVRYNGASSGTLIFWKGSQYGIGQGYAGGTANKFHFSLRKDGAWHHANGTTTPSLSTWYHVTGTYDGTNARVYVNGVLEGTSGDVASPINTGSDLTIGGYSGGDASNANLTDVRVYSVALSGPQVAELFAGSEATGATPTPRWKLDDGPQTGLVDGDPVIRQTSIDGNYIDFEQGVAEKRTTWSSTALGTTGGLISNGVNNGLVHVGTISTSTDGTFAIAFRTGASAFAADQTLFSTADEGVANEYLQIGIDATGKCFVEVNDSGTVHRVTGNTVLSNSTSYILTITSNDTAWAMRVNAVAQTLSVFGSNSGKWFGDLAGRDSVSIGFLKTTSESEWFEGSLGELTLYDSELTAPQITQLETYIADEAGITL